MWVSPEARGTQVAQLLVSAVVDAVKAAQADRIRLWVGADNARARAFYTRSDLLHRLVSVGRPLRSLCTPHHEAPHDDPEHEER